MLTFPEIARIEIGPVVQKQSLQGVIRQIVEAGSTIHVLLEENTGTIRFCGCTPQMAKCLRELRSGGPVRLNGIARRFRTQGPVGRWRLDDFRITGFSPLEDLPLDEVFARARAAVAEARERHNPPNGNGARPKR